MIIINNEIFQQKFSGMATSHMKTRVYFIYFVHDCSLSQKNASNSPCGTVFGEKNAKKNFETKQDHVFLMKKLMMKI